MIITNFVNEIDNNIKIKIKKQKDIGTNSKTGEKIKFTGVNIKIQGPSSTSENIITQKEANELYLSLKKFLNKYLRCNVIYFLFFCVIYY